jgi:cytochrome bd-type quinol oxidase subunit 2
MIKKIKSYSLSIVAVLTLLAPALVPVAVASAACSTTGSNVSKGVNIATGSPSSTDNCSSSAGVSNSDIGKAAKEIVTLFSIIVGVVSIIMIIYGGFRYITSGGDSGKVGNAKNTLIYAIVGLVIVALAQLIVHFVLNQASNVGASS